MIRIIENNVDLELPLGQGVHHLIAQIPNHLRLEDRLYKLRDPQAQEKLIMSILELAAGMGEDERLHFLFMPESSVPFSSIDKVISSVKNDLPENSVVILGIEHINLGQYRDLMKQHAEDNRAAMEMVMQDRSEDDRSKPVNTCVTLIKERNGRTRCFFFAKTHPFAGEESMDHVFDLYRGRHFLLFKCEHAPFTFMPLICFDYVYRDLYESNIMAIIEKANQLYFQHRQHLDLLAVIQCNPKPEHAVFKDVATGFYGEHLFKTPGTRDTATIFVNSSSETELEGSSQQEGFGYSSVVCGMRHRLPRIKLSEFRTDDFMGSPVSRLRFGPSTRLYLCRFFPYHETDPRSSRTMFKMTGIYRPGDTAPWFRISGDDLVMGVSEKEDGAPQVY